ncbi:hypothetical protein [Achromobacter sp.]|uniref:hypothetical protein n=1 Tax=Achromobacter sp. TaxID=134375 RepID=UPI003C787F8F
MIRPFSARRRLLAAVSLIVLMALAQGAHPASPSPLSRRSHLPYQPSKDVPDAVTQRLRDATGRALGDPAFRAAPEAIGRAVMPSLSAEEALAFHAEDIRLYRDMADGSTLPQQTTQSKKVES